MDLPYVISAHHYLVMSNLFSIILSRCLLIRLEATMSSAGAGKRERTNMRFSAKSSKRGFSNLGRVVVSVSGIATDVRRRCMSLEVAGGGGFDTAPTDTAFLYRIANRAAASPRGVRSISIIMLTPYPHDLHVSPDYTLRYIASWVRCVVLPN
jgi:hypothetical protein